MPPSPDPPAPQAACQLLGLPLPRPLPLTPPLPLPLCMPLSCHMIKRFAGWSWQTRLPILHLVSNWACARFSCVLKRSHVRSLGRLKVTRVSCLLTVVFALLIQVTVVSGCLGLPQIKLHRLLSCTHTVYHILSAVKCWYTLWLTTL